MSRNWQPTLTSSNFYLLFTYFKIGLFTFDYIFYVAVKYEFFYVLSNNRSSMTDRNKLSFVFISHVKVLFDILDENRSGLVKLSDIENHWEAGDCVIPRSVVIQSLRNVASPGGRLSFDTFVMGLERALALWKTNGSAPHSESRPISSTQNRESSAGSKPIRTAASDSVPSQKYNDSLGEQRRVEQSLVASSGPAKSTDAECNNGPLTIADILKKWQHERLSERQNRRGKMYHFVADDRFWEFAILFMMILKHITLYLGVLVAVFVSVDY